MSIIAPILCDERRMMQSPLEHRNHDLMINHLLFRLALHPRTLRKELSGSSLVWRKTAPTLHLRDPIKKPR
ncbi:hypothetical protein [Photorhabdus luminescens]|uniref:hypothetical protein n=1 Tax=Photorhabdus akhurstii TaxID=171438 RepID=UPI00126A40DA